MLKIDLGSKQRESPSSIFCFWICSSSRFSKLCKPSTTRISLYPKNSFFNLVSESKFSIFLIRFLCKYKEVKFLRCPKFSILLIWLLCKYKTFMLSLLGRLFWNGKSYIATKIERSLKYVHTILQRNLSCRYKCVWFLSVLVVSTAPSVFGGIVCLDLNFCFDCKSDIFTAYPFMSLSNLIYINRC